MALAFTLFFASLQDSGPITGPDEATVALPPGMTPAADPAADTLSDRVAAGQAPAADPQLEPVSEKPVVESEPVAAPTEEETKILAPRSLVGRSNQLLADSSEHGPSLVGFFFWTGVVMALLGLTFWILRRYAGKSRLLGGGIMHVLARKGIAQKQEILLVEVGPRILIVGATRDRLAALGEFRDPDEIARLRADLEPGGEGSARRTFDQSLREGLKEEERPATTGVTASIVDELADIRKTVHAWKA